MIPFYNMFAKGFGHINNIAVMDKVDPFDWLILPIGDRLIKNVPDVGTQLNLEFQLLFHLHGMKS